MELGPSQDPERVGPYRIIRRLGRGGMGIVYEVTRGSDETPLALKTVETRFLVRDDTQARRRFEHEIRVLSRLAHPNVVRIFDAGLAAHPQGYELLFMVTERLFGSGLEERLANHAVAPPQDAIRLTRDLADALNYLQKQGVEHRDIKPSNIFITDEGRTVLIDFGLATRGDLTRLTQAGQVIGSQSYMSPERLTGRDTNIASDVFALGVVLYRMLTGQLPFVAETLTDLAVKMIQGLSMTQKEAVPIPNLRALVERMLSPEPSARPIPATLIAELERLLGGFAATQAHDIESRPFIGVLGSAPTPAIDHPRSSTFGSGTASSSGPAVISSSGLAAGSHAQDFLRPTDASRSAPLVTGTPAQPPRMVHLRTLVFASVGTLGIGLAGGFGSSRVFNPPPPVVTLPPPSMLIPLAEGAPDHPQAPKIVRSEQPEPPPSPTPEAPVPDPTAMPVLTSAEAAYNYGQFALLEGQFERATRALERAVELNPVMAPAHRGLGDAYRALNRTHEAEKAYRTFLVLRPNAEDVDDVKKWLTALETVQSGAP